MALINGDNGHNILNDTAGDDTINGLDGNDTITVTSGNDSVNGGDGEDTLIVSYGWASDPIEGGFNQFAAPPPSFGVAFTGFEHFVVTTGSGDDVIQIAFFDGNDVVSTGAGDDFIVTSSGDDTAHGGAGNDQIDVGTGDDTADGGSGVDRISADLSTATSDIAWNLQANSYSGPIGGFTNFEHFGVATTGSGHDTVVTRNSALDDTVNLGDGDDRVTVVAGNDSVDGGSGQDTLIVNYGGTAAAVSGGFNQFADGAGRGVAFSQFERFVVTTGSGADVIQIAVAGGDDVVSTGAGADHIETNSGNDTLDGGTGADTMAGGAGNDKYHVDDVGDVVTELAGEGVDRVLSWIDYTLVDEVENLTLKGALAQAGTGNALANVLRGTAGDNTLSGLGGIDDLYGNDGDDGLLGGDGADRLEGAAGRDAIDGGSGADLIVGGTNKDTLTGGVGQDTFFFDDGEVGASASSADIITDFSRAEGDKVHVRQIDADTGAGGDQNFSFIGTGPFTGVTGQLHYLQAGGNTFIEGDTDGDGNADFVIRLDGLVNLVAGDFVL